jgi:hypothetical protein
VIPAYELLDPVTGWTPSHPTTLTSPNGAVTAMFGPLTISRACANVRLVIPRLAHPTTPGAICSRACMRHWLARSGVQALGMMPGSPAKELIGSVEFERFRRVRQIATPVFRDEYHVFDAHGAETGIIEAWFDRDDMAFLEQRPGTADARHFMDIESDTVAGAMKVALHAPIHQARLVPGFFKSP